MTSHTPILIKSRGLAVQDAIESEEPQAVNESDVETNLWRYSPLVSSASEGDFDEAGEVIRSTLIKCNKRKRNNRITASVMST